MLEIFADGVLDQAIRSETKILSLEWPTCFVLTCCLLWIHVCCSFVHDQYFIVSDNSSGQTNQLSLPSAEIRASFSNGVVQTWYRIFQFHLRKNKEVKIVV